jgi:hypothetical protein
MVSYIRKGTQAMGIWKQDSETNIWTQEGLELGLRKGSQWGSS